MTSTNSPFALNCILHVPVYFFFRYLLFSTIYVVNQKDLVVYSTTKPGCLQYYNFFSCSPDKHNSETLHNKECSCYVSIIENYTNKAKQHSYKYNNSDFRQKQNCLFLTVCCVYVLLSLMYIFNYFHIINKN